MNFTRSSMGHVVFQGIGRACGLGVTHVPDVDCFRRKSLVTHEPAACGTPADFTVTFGPDACNRCADTTVTPAAAARYR